MSDIAQCVNIDLPVVVYTDGSCIGNPGPGGWGVWMTRGNKSQELSGHVASTTNNRMELVAVIKALAAIKKGSTVEVRTDSQYVQKGMTAWINAWKARGWRTAGGKPVLNLDLWQQLEMSASAHKIAWQWVKAHAGNPGNERADALAKQGALRQSSNASARGR